MLLNFVKGQNPADNQAIHNFQGITLFIHFFLIETKAPNKPPDQHPSHFMNEEKKHEQCIKTSNNT